MNDTGKSRSDDVGDGVTEEEPAGRAIPAAGSTSHFTVRNSLLSISVVMTALIIWLIVSFWIAAYVQRDDAKRVLNYIELSEKITISLEALSAERILVRLALIEREPATVEVINQIKAHRNRGNGELREVISTLSEPGHSPARSRQAAAARAAFERLQSMRETADAEMAKPAKQREPSVEPRWGPTITDTILQMTRLNIASRFRTQSADVEIEAHLDLAPVLLNMAEFIDRERTVIAWKIAKVAPLNDYDLEKINIYRGRFLAAWRRVQEMGLQDLLREELGGATRGFYDVHFGDYDRVRKALIKSGKLGSPYQLTLKEWQAEAEKTLKNVRDLADEIIHHAEELAAAREAHGMRRLIIDTVVFVAAIVFGALVFWIVISWVTGPLRRITHTMTRLAEGAQSGTIPETHRQSEIGEMARAVLVFKETVDQNAQEISRVNHDLQSLNDNLEGLVEERTRDAEAARDQAIEASRAKSTFLANMSHELRTPLNAVIGYSELLLETAEDEGWEGADSDLNRIRSSGKHLLSLINHILDLSKIEAGKMEVFLESFQVREMVRDVENTAAPLAQQNGNELVINCPDDIGAMHSDMTKVRQVLFNLLSNACKFTKDGKVVMQVRRDPAGAEEHLEFQVTDTGIGMTPDELSAIFDAFQQADASTTREFGGTGLGLAITKTFCGLLGGGVAAASTQGEGSTFTVRLPANPELSRVSAEEMQDVHDRVPTERKATILIIDDDPLVRDLLRRHLARNGYQALTAVSGEEGLRMAHEHEPNAITLDVQMPQMDGWEVLTALKSEPALADIPVIMLTIVEDKQLGFSLGAAEYLSKPVEMEHLIGILDRYCVDKSSADILVIEDDEATRRLVGRSLEKSGCSVRFGETGREGIERLEEALPDLILLDLMMPEMDGFEFLAERARNPAWRAVPVVVMTAKILTASDRKRLNGGVDLLLQKGENDLSQLLPQLNQVIADRTDMGAEAEPVPKPVRGQVGKPRKNAEIPLIEGSAQQAGRAGRTGHILVVDDIENNRDLLARHLENDGHTVSLANGGREALAMADRGDIDAILLDLMMPDLNGFEVLARLKADGRTETIPVIMISALDEQEKAVQCLEIGAEDYLTKPFNAVLLRARINASLERKQAQDREQKYLTELDQEKRNYQDLILNVLPSKIVDRLNAGEELIADRYEGATVLFSDLVGFTEISRNLSPSDLVRDLNLLFSRYDMLALECGVEKVKTIGDAYMAVAGLPEPMENHAAACADMALGMVDILAELNPQLTSPFQIRVGLHTGPVAAGVIGKRKYVYDIWGTTVNHTSRYESYSEPGRIHVSKDIAEALDGTHTFEARGTLNLRSIGDVETFFLTGRKPEG